MKLLLEAIPLYNNKHFVLKSLILGGLYLKKVKIVKWTCQNLFFWCFLFTSK